MSTGNAAKTKLNDMKNLNTNELAVLESLVNSCNNYGSESFWTDELEVDGLSANQIKGYLSSLTKKNVIWCDNECGEAGVMDSETLELFQ